MLLKKTRSLFYPFYQPWIERGLSCFKKNISEKCVDAEAICNDFQTILYNRLHPIAFRTLIDEMHWCKEQNLLSGKNSSEEYLYYCNVILKDADYQSDLLKKYPVLSTCLDEACLQTTGNLCCLIQHFLEDIEQIEKDILHQKVDKLTGISANMSDSHNGGNSVIKLEIDHTCYLIYKPHTLDNEIAYYKLLEYLGEQVHLDFYTPAILSYETYGWEQFIPHTACQTEKEVQRFYQRMGIHLFLAYLLKTNDLHQENLIAYGEYPVFIDLEALWNTSKDMQNNHIEHKILRHLQDSVLSAGILPSYHWLMNENGVNISAISSGEFQTLPVKIPKLANAYTSDMCITYQFGTIPAAKNYVILKDKKVSPESYVNEIIQGFQNSYLFVQQYPDKFTEQLQGFHKLFSRHLITDTQKYTMLLNASYHPQLLDKQESRMKFLQNLHKGKIPKDAPSISDKAIQILELQDLAQGDIPSFQIKYDNQGLFAHGKILVKDFLNETPELFLLRRIHSLHLKDMHYQTMLIDVAMGIPDDLLRNDSADASVISKDKSMEYLRKDTISKIICNGLAHLLDYAIYSDDKQEISWATPQIAGKRNSRFQMRAMDMYLYDGLSGLFLLFYLAVKRSNFSEYTSIYEKLKHQFFSYTDRIYASTDSPSANTGIFAGESSIAAVYLILYKDSQESEYLEKAKKHTEIVYRILPTDENSDLISGKAGAILIFLELYSISCEQKYLQWAREAETLLSSSAIKTSDGIAWKSSDSEEPLLGMAHGNAGISLAYGRLYAVTGKPYYAEMLEQIIYYEHIRYNNITEDWYDYRSKHKNELNQSIPSAWCHGTGGILSARLELTKLNLPASTQMLIDADMKKAILRVKKSYLRNTLCLCHGVCGNLLILEKYLKQYPDPEVEKICKDGYCYVCNNFSSQNLKIIQEKYGVGLMTGYSGILLYLLISEYSPKS